MGGRHVLDAAARGGIDRWVSFIGELYTKRLILGFFHTTISPMETQNTMYDDLGTKVYNTLKEMIVKGDLAPGQKLVQEDIAEILGVSRTPLLQAISKLTKDHYIETIPRRGSYVKRFSIQEHLDIFDIRGQLEPMGAYQAAENITESDIKELEALQHGYERALRQNDPLELFNQDYAFHMVIMRCSGNKFLHDMLKNFNNILCNSERLLKTPSKTFEEHAGILNALRTRDPNGAKELMFYHINGGARARLSQVLHERDQTMKEDANHAES